MFWSWRELIIRHLLFFFSLDSIFNGRGKVSFEGEVLVFVLQPGTPAYRSIFYEAGRDFSGSEYKPSGPLSPGHKKRFAAINHRMSC